MLTVVRRLFALSVLALLSAAPAFAQSYTYSVYIDGDNNPSTGCNVTLPGGTVSGAETVVTATINAGSPPQVASVTSATCSGGSFGAPTAAGTAAVGVGAGNGGTTAIEISAALASLVSSSSPAVRLYVVARSASGSDVLLTTDGTASGGAILFSVNATPGGGGTIQTPSMGIPAVLLLIAALLVFGSRSARRRLLKRALISLAFMSGIAGAAIFNWNGIQPIATDPAGDSTSGESAIDLRWFFAAFSNGNLYFRIDCSGNLGVPLPPPVAVADSYSTSRNTALTVPAPGVLGNDTVNSASISANTNPTQGTLVLNANGGFTYTPHNGYTGADSFTYTLTNSGGSSTATVSLSVTAGPVAIADSYTTTVGTALSVPAPGVLGNDQLGMPDATLQSFGGGSLGGAVTDHAPGSSATLAGASLTVNANGSVQLGAPATAGTYTFQYRIGNVHGTSDATVTVQVNQAPTITSANTTTFTVGSVGTFTVTTTGTPAPTLTRTGTMPAGISFIDNGNGTATLTGTPAAGSGGTYPLVFTATNSVGTSTPQNFTLVVHQAAAITSASSVAFTVSTAGSFSVTATGNPIPALAESGALPAGVSFNPATGVLSGTPAAGSNGSYPIMFTATNGVGSPAVQNFILTVQSGPSITSAATTTFLAGSAGSFNVVSTGTPTPTLAVSGTLPSAVHFTDNGNGTGTLSGTPAAGTGGSYSVTFTATNGIGSPATQNFTLQVNEAAVANADAYTAITGTPLSVAAPGVLGNDTLGTPAATLQSFGGGSLGGAVTDNTPGTLVSLAGGSFTINTNGSVSLTAPNAPGVYTVQYRISNSVGVADATVTLTVNQPTSITSAATANFSVGTNGSFTITTAGTPAATSITLTGCTLPAGLTFAYAGGATATISGTPSAGGSASCTVTAGNGFGTPATQTLTVAANSGPVAVDDAQTTKVGTPINLAAPGLLQNDTLGFPAATLTSFGGGSLGGSVTDHAAGTSALLPNGGTLTINADGSVGMTAPTTAGTYTVLYRITNSQGTSDATLTIQVNQAPQILSPNSVTFLAGTAATPFTITTSGTPTVTSITLTACTLPAGLTFNYSSGATATISGTPTAGGTVTCTVTASNGVSPDATQTLTITVNQGPAAVADTASVVAGSTLTLSGSNPPGPGTGPSLLSNDMLGTPAATLTFFGGNSLGGTVTSNAAGASVTLAGGTLQVNADGSLTLTTPSQAGEYTFLYRIDNGINHADALVTIDVDLAPAITSANNAAFVLGQSNTFSVTTTGFPKPTLTKTAGTLPTGVTFVDNGDGTATLAGTPAAGTAGSYPITITAHNGIGSDATQNFTLQVNEAPAITSANTTTFTVGTAGSFNVTATGTPAPTFSETGALPSGVTLTSAGVLSGTPAANTGGSYPITITASNGVGTNATQSFTLVVNQAPAITSTASATFVVGTAGTFTVTTTGNPTATISETGALPSGVTLTDNGNGTATLAGTPATGTAGSYPITITAHNGIGSDATQSFTLQVNQAPAITSGNTATFHVGTPGTFTVTATGTPTPTLSETGALPSGVTFNTSTGILSGTPAVGTGGSYTINFSASNGVGTAATQSFNLIVDEAPQITSANSATFPIGQPHSFTVNTSGYPSGALMAITETGVLPTGVMLTNNNNGTATISGIPQANTAGPYSITIGADNGIAPAASQPFTLTVTCPVITVNGTLPTGLYQTSYGPQTFTQSGGATPVQWSSSGLPAGLSINSASGSVSGTPTTTVSAATVTITATDAYGCTGSATINNFKIAPIATGDSYTHVGNTHFVVLGTGTGAPTTPHVLGSTNLLANDQGPGPLQVSPAGSSVGTANGGSVTIQPDGSFIFTPKVGDTAASDSFTYTIVDANGVSSAPGTVTLTRSGRVWYVDGNATGTGTGRSHDPFKSLASVSTAHIAGTSSANGDVIFVESGSTPTATPGAISLKAYATLWGQGLALPTDGTTIPSLSIPIQNTGAAATKPVLNGTVTFAGNGTSVSSLDINIATAGMQGINNTGTLIGLAVTNNVTVTTTTGTAVNLANVGGTLTFRSVSANGAPNGISLSGTSGTFTVTGDGGTLANGSGGTIIGTSGAGALLSNAAGVSLRQMNITIANTTANGVDAALAGTTLALDYMTIVGPGGTLNANGNGIALNSIGSLRLTHSKIMNSAHDGLKLLQAGGSLANTSVVYGNTFSGNTEGDGVQVQTDGAGAIAGLNIGGAVAGQSNTFTNNNIGVSIEQAATTASAFGNITFAVMNNTFSNNAASNGYSNAIGVESNGTHATGGTLTGQIENNTIGTLGVKDSGSAVGDGVRVDIEGGVHGVLTISGNTISEVPNASGFELRGVGGPAGDGGLNVKLTGNTVNNPSGSNLDVCGIGSPQPCPASTVYIAADNAATGTQTVCAIASGNTIYDPASTWPTGDSFTGAIAFQMDQLAAGAVFNLGGSHANAVTEINATNTVQNNNTAVITGAVNIVPAANCGTFPP